MKTLIQFLILCFMITGCDTQNDPAISSQLAKPIVLKASQQIRINQDNEFAIDLFKKTIDNSKDANILTSPLSVSIALGMAWNGATNETKTEMEAALKMKNLSVNDINEYYKVMQTTLPKIDPKTTLKIANSIWYKTGYPVKQEFINVNINYFDAKVRELDFSQTWAKDTINNWCALKTNNHITDILDEIPSNAIMYVINAVYFKGIWRNQFDKKLTVEKPFTNETNTQVNVNMMYQKDTFNYTTDAYAQYLDMPYGNKAFSMTVILPNYGKKIEDVLQNLTVESWNTNLNNLSSKEVSVYFPRFKSKNKFLLNDVLKAMGMKRAFEDHNEFKNINEGTLYVSRVLHDTSIEVTEEGTEAAAVTVVEISEKSMMNIAFNANRPFMYVIRENSTGVILFIGKMGNVEKY